MTTDPVFDRLRSANRFLPVSLVDADVFQRRFLAHAATQGVERHAFLGDFVGYGADPAWVVDRIREPANAVGEGRSYRRRLPGYAPPPAGGAPGA